MGADATDRPWLVVATRRTEGQTVFEEGSHVDVLNLAPLDAAAADRLLQVATAGAPLPTHRLEALGQRSGGNPLFLLELAAGASELDELPDSVEGVISARIDVLEPDLRRLLRSASVLGMSVELATLEAILSIDAATGAVPLDRLPAVSEFLAPTSPGHVEFVHHLVRDTAYEGLPFRRRTVLHARVVDVLEAQYGDSAETHAALLSQHCFFGDRFHASWEYSRAAADGARQVYANADAAVLYRRAVASADRLPSVNKAELTAALKSLGEVYDDLGEFDEAQRILIRARGVSAGDPMASGSVELNLAIIRQRMGRPEVALRGLTRALHALEEVAGAEASSLRAALLTRYAWTRNFQGKPRETIRWANMGIEEATSCSNESLVALCLEIIEWAYMGIGEFPDDSPALRALRIYETVEDLPGQASTYNTLGAREYYRGNWDLALSYYSKSLEAYRKCGTSWGTVAPMASEAEVLCDQGRVELAEPMALEALQISRGANMPNDVAFVRTLLGRMATQQHRFEDARAYLADAAAYYSSTGVTSLLLQNQGFLAECLLEEGRAGEALEVVASALRAAKRAEGVEFVLPLLERVHGVASARSGHEPEGMAELISCADTARQRGALPELTWALRDLVALAGDDQAATEGWDAELAQLRRQLGVVETP